MKVKLHKLITKLLIIIVSLVVMPSANPIYAQDKGAKSVKSEKGGKKKGKKPRRGSFKQRKRTSKRHWKNQDKATRKRMKRAARNAKRRQKGKPMKNNRLV